MHILIVDDDEDIREVLGLILRSAGHQVEEAADGIDALARLRGGSSPSLILLDMMMPRLDGEGVMKAMKSDPRLACIPVWIISGHPAARERASQLGAVGCLVKPIKMEHLLAVIQSTAGGAKAWA